MTQLICHARRYPDAAAQQAAYAPLVRLLRSARHGFSAYRMLYDGQQAIIVLLATDAGPAVRHAVRAWLRTGAALPVHPAWAEDLARRTLEHAGAGPAQHRYPEPLVRRPGAPWPADGQPQGDRP